MRSLSRPTAVAGRPVHGLTRRRDSVAWGILSIVGSTLLFSFLWAIVKDESSRYPVAEVTFFRNLFAIIPVMVLVAGRPVKRALRVRRIYGHLWRAAIGTTSMLLSFTSYHLLPLADATAISFMAPLGVTALSVPMLGERVGVHRWAAVIIGFGGVLVIVRPSAGLITPGIAVALAAAVANSLSQITIRQLNTSDKPLAIVFYFTVFSALLTALPLPLVWVTPGLGDLAMLVLAGLIGGCGQYLMTRGFSMAPAAVVSPFNYAGLLWATGLEWALWGDVPASHVIAGAVIVIASGLYLLYRETLRRPRR